MTTRTYVTKSGDTYEWEETPEVLEALKKLHEANANSNSGTQSSTAKV